MCANQADKDSLRKHSQYNVFIFNYIKNNQQDIALLVDTFEKKRDCDVIVYEQLDLETFHKKVDYITTKFFTHINYVIIVILANKNYSKDLLLTSDGHYAFINRDLLSRIQYNKTLCMDESGKKKKLIVITQINQNCGDDDEYERAQTIYKERPLKTNIGLPETAATLKFYGVKHIALQFQLNATDSDQILENYWNVPNAPVSPFIKSFCQHFGVEQSFKNVFDCVSADMRADENAKETPSLAVTIPDHDEDYILGDASNISFKKRYRTMERKQKAKHFSK